MKTSVIICTYNKPDRLYASLCSFENVDYDKNDFEIIVCDDGSQAQYDKQKFNNFELNLNILTLKHNGRSAARNAGINSSHGDIIIFSDDDTIVERNFINEHLNFQSLYTDIMVLGNRLQIYIDEDNIRGINKYNIAEKIEYCKTHAKEDIYSCCTKPYIFQNNPSFHWLCSTTGNMSIGKKWIDKFDGFDNQFSGWGFEDIELAYRYSKNGMKFYYAGSLKSYHLEHPRNKTEMISEMKSNIAYFFNKYSRPNDIAAYWDFFRGTIPLKEFDRQTFGEFLTNTEEEEYFYLFKQAHLDSLYNME